MAAKKFDKPTVAKDVVREWRAMDPPGRFLARMDGGGGGGDVDVDGDDDDGDGNDGGTNAGAIWYDVGDHKARRKASQSLRERNGNMNKAVTVLVKTVTATGEACPEDYATLMNKAGLIKAQYERILTHYEEGGSGFSIVA
ncbi:hypothetical protein ACHAW5_005359 [Stephanodiscus triporus]|uniref:DUF6824 domain-containing protein n=1 Tax=Stephanodiscus triporus TaxID=2934178 RepID=A0ABD3N6W6_9STRA